MTPTNKQFPSQPPSTAMTTHIRSVTSTTNNHLRPPPPTTTCDLRSNPLPHHHCTRQRHNMTTPHHTLPMTKQTTTIRHGSQMTVSMHEQKQTTRKQGEAHLPPPLSSLIRNPGATSLWAMWQPNDERQPAVIICRCCIFYDAMVSTPVHIHLNPPH